LAVWFPGRPLSSCRGNSSARTRDRGCPVGGSARKALDSWAPSSEASVAAALEDAYRDAFKRAAAFIEEKGQPGLAVLLKRLAAE